MEPKQKKQKQEALESKLGGLKRKLEVLKSTGGSPRAIKRTEIFIAQVEAELDDSGKSKKAPTTNAS